MNVFKGCLKLLNACEHPWWRSIVRYTGLMASHKNSHSTLIQRTEEWAKRRAYGLIWTFFPLHHMPRLYLVRLEVAIFHPVETHPLTLLQRDSGSVSFYAVEFTLTHPKDTEGEARQGRIPDMREAILLPMAIPNHCVQSPLCAQDC